MNSRLQWVLPALSFLFLLVASPGGFGSNGSAGQHLALSSTGSSELNGVNQVLLNTHLSYCSAGGLSNSTAELGLVEQFAMFVRGLYNTSYWPARWNCGTWTPLHGWSYLISDLIIFLAYFAIPVVIMFFVRKRKYVVFRKIFFLFAAFILLCGFTHLIDAASFWVPAYALNGLVKFATAVVSVGTVIALVNIVPKALTLKTAVELEKEIELRKQAEKKLNEKVEELEKVNELMVDREIKMIELKKHINQLKV